MVLIDAVESVDEADRSLVASATIRPEWSENWVAIELMAQASAALAGIFDRNGDPDAPARPGLLLGTRRLTLAASSFEVGRRYTVTARNVFNDAESACFECSVRDGEEVLASATLNAYRPLDVGAFLSEQRVSHHSEA